MGYRVTGMGLVVSALVGVAAPAFAGEAGTRETGALRVTTGGESRMDYVYREPFFGALFPRAGLPGATRARARAESYVDMRVTLFMEFEFKERFYAYFELETAPDPYAGEGNRWGDKAQGVRFEQAFVRAEQFWSEHLDIYVGVQDLREDFRASRGHGQLFLDVSESEHPWTMAAHAASTVGGFPTGVSASVSGVALGTAAAPSPFGPVGVGFHPAFLAPDLLADPDPGVSESSWNPFLGGNAWVNNLVGQAKRSEFGGLKVVYELMEKAILARGFAGVITETGTAQLDTQLYGAALEARFMLPSGSREYASSVKALYAYLASSPPIGIHSFNFSVDLWLLKDYLEAYGEFVGQVGTYTRFGRPATSAGFASNSTRQKSYAWYAGGRIELPLADLGLTSGGNTSGQFLFLDCAYWNISGDSGNPYKANEDFVSFESVSGAMILEGSDAGLDIDTNYWAIKGEGGVTLESLSLSLFYGMFRLNDAPFGNNGSTAVVKDRMGNECDVRVRYLLDNVELSAGAGFLFDSNFFNSLTAQRSTSNAVRPDRTGSKAVLYTVGVKVKF